MDLYFLSQTPPTELNYLPDLLRRGLEPRDSLTSAEVVVDVGGLHIRLQGLSQGLGHAPAGHRH